MPGLVAVAGYIFFVFMITEDEAVLGHQRVDFGKQITICNHVVVVVIWFAVNHHTNIYSETSMVLGISRHGDILFTIIFAVLLFEIIPEVNLVIH